MSCIELLLIQGIRSFGPDDKDKALIKFSSPLTLILGQNGCGKTTIIEALKYATCGEFPAGTEKGRYFIHDPKLAHVTEVKGHVKMKYRDTSGNAKVISRTARVVQKCKKLEFNSLDATLSNGEGKESLTSRCADMDFVVCQTLGVSQAVLTNVVFCHQEDSSWPLEKGQKIKERFDAIFGITEYNKCLDYFRQLTKEMEIKKSLLKKDVDYSNKFWEEAKEKKKNLDELKAKFGANQDSIAAVENQMAPILNQIKEITEKEMNFARHMSKVMDKKNRRQLIIETIDETKKEIQQKFNGSKESLIMEIQSFNKKLDETNSRLVELIADRDDLKAEEIRLQKEIDAKTMLVGQLQRDEDQNNEKTETRNMLLKNLAGDLKIAVMSNSQLNETNGDEMLKSMELKIREYNAEIRQLQETQRNTEKSIQNKIDVTREKKATLNQDIRMKEKRIEDNKREIERITSEIKEVDKSGEKLVLLEKNLKMVNEQLEETVKSLNVDKCKQEIENSHKNIKRLEEKLSAVDKDIKELLLVSVEKANLEKLYERKEKLEMELVNMKNKHCSSFQHLLFSVPGSDFKLKIQDHIEKMISEIRSLETSINNNERELSVLTEKKRNLEDLIRQKMKKVSQDEDTIEECCGKDDIKQYYENVKTKLQEANDVKGTLSASQFMFGKYVEKLNAEEPLCPLCRREFDDRKEVIDVIEDLTRRLKEMPARLLEVENEIKKYSECQHKVTTLLPLHENIIKTKTEEIPLLRAQLNEVIKKIDAIKSQLDISRNNLMGPQTDKDIAANILSDAIQMDQYLHEIQNVELEIRNAESKLPANVSKRSLQEANNEQDAVKEQLSNLRENVEIEQRQLSKFNEKLNNLRERKADLTAQQLKMIGSVQQRKTLTEKLDELIKLADVYEEELQATKMQVQPASEELDENNRKLCQFRAKHEMLLDEKRKTLNEYEKRIEEIRILQLAVKSYIKKGGSKLLSNTKEELTQKRVNKETLEHHKIQLEKDIEYSKQFQDTHKLKKHDLEANLKLRSKQEELAKVEEEINELEGHIEIINYDQLRTQKDQLEKKKKIFEEQKIFAEGRQKEIKFRIRDSERELDNEMYKNAEGEYRKNLVKLTVTVKAIEDLKIYEKAMDWAMMHFHKERMKMINEIVRELWKTIYKGNDIDYIEIKTDESTSTASGRRSYNYKVIQSKSGIEMDMAGRCSAGQKVLACLIVRMALAETFSKNCGILALDEPTTNLDRDNVESLSDALAEIVERRSRQRNFQLLVITHDEDFLKKLFRVEKIEHYLEVKRDRRGKSVVIQRDV